MATQTQVDNTLAIRLAVGTIRSIAQEKRISKKKIKEAVAIIEQAAHNLQAEPIEETLLRDTDDQEIKYFMIVNDIDGYIGDSWKEELKQHSVPAEVEEAYMVEQAQDIIESWNKSALSRNVQPRKVIKVIKVITHTRELYHGK